MNRLKLISSVKVTGKCTVPHTSIHTHTHTHTHTHKHADIILSQSFTTQPYIMTESSEYSFLGNNNTSPLQLF